MSLRCLYVANKLGKVYSFRQIQFFFSTGCGDLRTGGGDFQDVRDFFCIQVHPEQSTQFMIIWCQLREFFTETVKETRINLLKMSFDPIPVIVELDILVDRFKHF